MIDCSVNTPLPKSSIIGYLRSKTADALFATVNNIISDLQSITITKLAWLGACSVYTAIVGWDDSLTLLCAFGMRLLTSKKLNKLGPEFKLKIKR